MKATSLFNYLLTGALTAMVAGIAHGQGTGTGTLTAVITLDVDITAIASVQGATSTTGSTTTADQPKQMLINTKSLLQTLAFDENAAGTGTFTSGQFPKGADLVAVVPSPGGTPTFQVVDKQGNLIVDVSNILTATASGKYHVVLTRGKSTTAAGWGAPTVFTTQIETITFDDTAITGSKALAFTLTGPQVTHATTTGGHSGSNHEVVQSSIEGASGDGTTNGTGFIVEGEVHMNTTGKGNH